jgi:hypothetical protein
MALGRSTAKYTEDNRPMNRHIIEQALITARYDLKHCGHDHPITLQRINDALKELLIHE